MCGRTAQTLYAVQIAAQRLGCTLTEAQTEQFTQAQQQQQQQQQQQSSNAMHSKNGRNGSSAEPSSSSNNDDENNNEMASSLMVADTTVDHTKRSSYYPPRDNFNLSPGMDAFVFCADSDSTAMAGNATTMAIGMHRKVWGLVPRGGTKSQPLPTGMNQHFSNMMFNARADTLYERPTFARLASSGKTCLIAVDGFFEWKSETAAGKGKKQPYFVYRKQDSDGSQVISSSVADNRPYLLFAGLWTSVPTGREDEPVLDTFTIITTDVCDQLGWLHTRMPVCIWDEQLALQWLHRPSQQLHRKLEESARISPPGVLQWHAVSTDMTSPKFRSEKAIQALPPMKTVKSFFSGDAPGKASGEENDRAKPNTKTSSGAKTHEAPTEHVNKTPDHGLKRSAAVLQSPTNLPSSNKKTKTATPGKRGTITAFFHPKNQSK